MREPLVTGAPTSNRKSRAPLGELKLKVSRHQTLYATPLLKYTVLRGV